MCSRLSLLGVLCTTGLAGACGGDDDGPTSTPITLQFAGQVGDDDFACGGSYSDLGITSTTFEADDFRLYVHDIRLVDADGAETAVELDQDGMWQNGGVALLDFEDGSAGCESGTLEVNDVVHGVVPEGTEGAYTGIRFRLGVPVDRNHSDIATTPPPLNLTSMFWSWTGGYKFLRIEGSSATVDGWRFHLGATGCDGMGAESACTDENVAEIELDGFDPATNVLVADIAGLVAGSDLDTNASGPPGCMSTVDDPDCEPVFHALGLPFGAAPAPGPQTFFRVE